MVQRVQWDNQSGFSQCVSCTISFLLSLPSLTLADSAIVCFTFLHRCTSHTKKRQEECVNKRKGFNDNMFWEVQGARTEEEFWVARKFSTNFPSVYDYLAALEKKSWVNYAQIAAGATTFGWHGSNQAESGQGMIRACAVCTPSTSSRVSR